ncbi:hypothetical protein QBC38DRAFT_359985 [Podospora fimiseda]|uniref:Helicase C-terminal domain-containing protein n=1 Tax=Podospora fimiseda TaxID=252190 RepID=A0AAN7BTC8_9PEZI|nr:hypothetical protein QBC38DRAFT_359985 [Podospora fimiseda]
MKPAEVEEEEEEYSINKAEDIDFGMANPDVVDSYLGSCNTGNNEAEWHGCLDFFRINVDEYNRQIASKSADSQHVRVPFKKFPGMTVGLFDYQLMGVYTLIKFLLDDVSGGFLCDEQGLGKTQEMFGLIALAHNLRRCKTEVHEFWSPPKTSAQKKRPATVRHNLKTDLGAQSCPYDQKYGFRCYCYNEPTRQIADRLPDGPNLFIAPAKNCAPMIREAKTKLDTKTLKIRGYGKDVDKDNQLSTRDIALLHASIRPKQKPGKTDFEYTYQAPTGQSHYLIFVSPQSIDKLNSEFNILVKGKKKSALLPGMIMLDEFHEYALTPESRTLAWLNHLKKCTLTSQQPTPLVYFVSGTPIDHSPADLAPAISHLESSTWSKPTHPLHPASRSQLQSLLTNFSTYTALQSAGSTIPPNQVKAYYTHLSQILTHLMIRRLVTDSFLTRPLTTLGPLKISIITHSIPTKYLPAITALQSSFSPTPSLPLLLSSTFPALLSDPSHTKFTFLPSEPLSFPLKPLHSPYTPHISTWTTSSPKLLSLTTTLKSMLSDTSPIPNSASSLKKLCLFSPHESETLILFLYLSTHLKLPSLKPIYLHPALSQPDKQKIIDSFLKEGNGTPNVLVSSFASGGTGLNLQRANYLVVTGPGFTKRETAQVFGRVHRVGQKCGRVRLEMLVTTGHEGEEKVLEGWGSGIGGLRRVQEKEVPEEK